MQPEDLLRGWRHQLHLDDPIWEPPTESDLALLAELKAKGLTRENASRLLPAVYKQAQAEMMSSLATNHFLTLHRNLREASERVVSVTVAKERPADTVGTLYYERNGDTITFVNEAYGLLKERA